MWTVDRSTVAIILICASPSNNKQRRYLRREFGDTLGLRHSKDPKLIMYPYYDYKMSVHWKDIIKYHETRWQQLYIQINTPVLFSYYR